MQLLTKSEFPSPSSQKPFAQVEWLFDQRASLEANKSTRKNYSGCKGYFVKHLQEELSGKAISELTADQLIDEYALIRFKTYLDDSELSSHSKVGHLSAARNVIKFAIDNEFISLKDFINAPSAPASRETDDRRPYSEKEFDGISLALDQDLAVARKALNPYVRTGLGQDPRYVRGGWAKEENQRWYFENILECQPVTKNDRRPDQAKFYQYASRYNGSIRGLYQRWGVIPLIDEEVITPFLFRLVQITGLNSSVAMTLKVGDFCERHPLTDQPYIRYWKERARGEKELHLSLFDTKWMRLNSEQAREVSTLWKNLLDLTRRFRHQLDENKKELLFVYQSPSVKMMGKPHTLLNDSLTHMRWADRFVKKYNLCDDQGKPLRLTLARFRPSLVSRLVKKDVDLDVIQSILGHKSVIQTIRYIDSHDFAPEARAAVSKCLESIYSNHLEQKKENKPVATKEKIHEPVVFATAMALCKNVFSPPEQIKKGAGLAEGQACTNFNMCLRCSNVVIMKDHLPKLFALQESYLTALKNGLAQSTHKSAVIQTLSILDNLLDPKKSEFSEVELNWAKSLSEAEDPLVDTVAYRGVIS